VSTMVKKSREELRGKSKYPIFGIDLTGDEGGGAMSRAPPKEKGPESEEKKKKKGTTPIFGQ